MGGIFAGQLPSLEFYQEFLTTTEKLDQYMSSQAEYIDSYYFGKLIGDSASLVLGAGGTVQGAIKFFKGAGIAVGSAATPMGTMVGSVAVVLSAEGVQVMAVSGTVVVAAIGNIPGDYDKFHYYDRLPDGGSSSDELKNVYNSIKESPNYPEGFEPRQNGTTRNTVKNKGLLEKLREIESGTWKKVYKDGYDLNGNEISIHYFQSESGKVFDVKVKTGWSN